MINLENKQKIIDDFCRFVEMLPDTDCGELQEKPVDLFTLLQELIALKTEVKQESRHVKTALDSFKDVFETLQQSHQVLSQELTQRRQEQTIQLQQQQQKIVKPLLLELLELRDRLQQAITHSNAYRPTWLQRLFKRQNRWVAGMLEGQHMTLRRLDQLLADQGVSAITVMQREFNPELMQAIAVATEPELPNGIVVAEVRQGFLWNEQVLRPSEVKVNKLKLNLYEE